MLRTSPPIHFEFCSHTWSTFMVVLAVRVLLQNQPNCLFVLLPIPKIMIIFVYSSCNVDGGISEIGQLRPQISRPLHIDTHRQHRYGEPSSPRNQPSDLIPSMGQQSWLSLKPDKTRLHRR